MLYPDEDLLIYEHGAKCRRRRGTVLLHNLGAKSAFDALGFVFHYLTVVRPSRASAAGVRPGNKIAVDFERRKITSTDVLSNHGIRRDVVSAARRVSVVVLSPNFKLLPRVCK